MEYLTRPEPGAKNLFYVLKREAHMRESMTFSYGAKKISDEQYSQRLLFLCSKHGVDNLMLDSYNNLETRDKCFICDENIQESLYSHLQTVHAIGTSYNCSSATQAENVFDCGFVKRKKAHDSQNKIKYRNIFQSSETVGQFCCIPCSMKYQPSVNSAVAHAELHQKSEFIKIFITKSCGKYRPKTHYFCKRTQRYFGGPDAITFDWIIPSSSRP